MILVYYSCILRPWKSSGLNLNLFPGTSAWSACFCPQEELTVLHSITDEIIIIVIVSTRFFAYGLLPLISLKHCKDWDIIYIIHIYRRNMKMKEIGRVGIFKSDQIYYHTTVSLSTLYFLFSPFEFFLPLWSCCLPVPCIDVSFLKY